MGVWGLGIGDLGMGDWAQSPIPNPQSKSPCINFNLKFIFNNIIIQIINIDFYYKYLNKEIKIISID